jgi:hypothetical protein
MRKKLKWLQECDAKNDSMKFYKQVKREGSFPG